MTQQDQLKQIEELWDSLSPELKTIFSARFEYQKTIKNTSNASSHIQVLEEENKGMVELLEGNNCNFIVKISDLHCEWEFGLPISDNYSIEHIVLAIEEKFKVERSYCKLIKSFNGK